MKLKSIKVWLILITFLSLTLSSCGFAKTESTRDLNAVVDVPYYRNSENDIVTLKIPEGYIDRWVVGNDKFTKSQDAIYLHGSGVDLKPETKDNRKEFEFPDSLKYEIRLHTTNLYWLVSKNISSEVDTERFFRWVSNQKMTACQFEIKQPVIYNLKVKVINRSTCPKTPPVLIDDIYFTEYADKRLKTVIICNSKEVQESITPPNGFTPIPVPRCEHYFFMKNINSRVQLDYDRAYLPQWQQLESNVIQLLTSFLSSPSK
jgi:hypothetical protein